MNQKGSYFEKYKNNKWALRALIFCLSIATIFGIITLFYLNELQKHWRSVIIIVIFCSLTITLIYRYISPYLVQKSNHILTIYTMGICILVISSLFLGMMEFKIIHYPDVMKEELFPITIKISYFLVVGILIYYAARSFHLMINTIRFNDNRLQLEINSYQKEIDEMRMQSNPNFLLQSLKNINHLLESSNDETVLAYCSETSELLKNQLVHTQADYISLEKEIEWLQHYLNAQKIFYSEQFDYEIEVKNPDVFLQLIPPLLFQPIVEQLLSLNFSKKTRASIHIDIEDVETKEKSGIVALFSTKSSFQDSVNISTTFSISDLYKRIQLINSLGEVNIDLEEFQKEDMYSFKLTVL